MYLVGEEGQSIIIQHHLFTFWIYSDVISHNTRVWTVQFGIWNPLNKQLRIIQINIRPLGRIRRVSADDDDGAAAGNSDCATVSHVHVNGFRSVRDKQA